MPTMRFLPSELTLGDQGRTPKVRGSAHQCVRLLCAATFTLLIAAHSISPAYAHSVLVSVVPADQSLTQTAPTEIVLTFDENVQDVGNAVVVLAPNGQHVESGPPNIVNSTVTQRLKPITVPGHYSIEYRVVSVDGHPVSAVVGFDYLERQAQPVSEATTSLTGPIVITLVGALAVLAVAWLLWRRPTAHAIADDAVSPEQL